jgi:hypothetical protein
MASVLGVFGLLVGGILVYYLVTEGSDRPLYIQIGLLLGYLMLFTLLVAQCSG